MPRIGKRILKSAFAVFLCFIINMLRNQAGVVFYSCIASVLCIQQDVQHTKKVGLNRVVGTFIGGLFGMLFLVIKDHVPIQGDFFLYCIISIMIIPIIYVTVVFKKTSASYISCVVFMSIAITHRMDSNPFLFAWNRMLDTLIGIGVAYVVNKIHLPHHKRKDTLYVTTLDHMLLQENETLSGYTKIKLKELLEDDCAITLATSRTPSSLLPILKDIKFSLPLIVMNGAALYDCKSQTYSHCHFMKKECVEALTVLANKYNFTLFQNSIHYHVLHTYYHDFQSDIEEAYYHAMRKMPYHSYVYEKDINIHDCLYVTIVGSEEQISVWSSMIQKQPWANGIVMYFRTFQDNLIMEIYSKSVSKKDGVLAIQKECNYSRLCAFAYHKQDVELLEMADRAYTSSSAVKEVIDIAEIIDHVEKDGVIKRILKDYHFYVKKR